MADAARAVGSEVSAPAAAERTRGEAKSKRGWPWRAWLRAVHRDVGYLVVGLTVIYAVSGLAVNHIDDFNSNYATIERTHRLALPLPDDDDDAARAVGEQLGIEGEPTDVYRIDDEQLEIAFPERTVTVNLARGEALEQGQQPRAFLRVANWLHLNRGKKAWTYIADGYAVLLLALALSGMFMIKGRNGLFGRGAVLVVLGAAVPVLYVVLSGGPG